MYGNSKNISDEKAKIIDEEVTEFILRAEETAENILNENIKDLHNRAKALLEFETISGDEMKTIIEALQFQMVESESLDDFNDKVNEEVGFKLYQLLNK